MTDRVEKQIKLKAPVSRIWTALTDHREFGQWFGVNLEGPFVPGKATRGQNTYPGFEHAMSFTVVKREPERFFSYRWHPFAVDAAIDYSREEPTLVEFTLEAIAGGTLLRVVESGFDKIPAGRRPEAFRMHEGGWEAQLKNIERHVSPNAS